MTKKVRYERVNIGDEITFVKAPLYYTKDFVDKLENIRVIEATRNGYYYVEGKYYNNYREKYTKTSFWARRGDFEKAKPLELKLIELDPSYEGLFV